jgi:hypothetical protein
MGNACNLSHHRQRRIYQFIITWNTRNIPVSPRSLSILYNYSLLLRSIRVFMDLKIDIHRSL